MCAHATITTVFLLSAAALAPAQALLDRRPAAPVMDPEQPTIPMATDGTLNITDVSLTAIQPPPPRTFEENDLVTIIISERARIDRDQRGKDQFSSSGVQLGHESRSLTAE